MIRNRKASLDELVESAIAPVVARVAAAIARQVARLTAQQLEAELSRGRGRGRAVRVARPSPSRRRAVEMTKWVADNRARRVPNFVIALTGLKTKKEIVAKYGANVAFEKGKSLPPEAKGGEAKREVKAKPPTIRKRAAVA